MTPISQKRYRRPRWRKMTWALIVWTVPLAACATQTSTTTVSSATPTKQAFIRQVDKVCQAAHPQLRAVQAQIRAAGPHIALTPANRQQGARWLRQTASIGEQEDRQIAALTPPAGDRATISAYLAKSSEFDDVARQAAAALLDVNVPQLQALTVQLRQADRSARQIAHQYGFRVCATPY